MRPIKTTVLYNIHRSIKSCPHSTWLYRINFQIATWTRLVILDTVMFHWDRLGLLTSTSKWVSPKTVSYFSPFSSSDGYRSYFHELLQRLFQESLYVHNYLLALWLRNYLLALWLSAQMCWQWVGPKVYSLLSKHRLIGSYFVTTESDKRISFEHC